MFQACMQYILGIRPTLTGLLIDPCIPRAWDGFKATREFRGAVYRIIVENPAHVCKGVRRVEVDGQAIEGNLLPVFEGGIHSVRVVMG